MKILPVAAAFAAVLALCGAAPIRDGARIENSGSTNASGWTIVLRSDATGTAAVGSETPLPFHLTVSQTARFFRDVAALRRSRVAGGACMKSVSFGSRTDVVWHGWESVDVSCPQRIGAGLAVANDVTAIEAAAGISGRVLHRLHPVSWEPAQRTGPAKTPRQGP
jgi:hypothetical protein